MNDETLSHRTGVQIGAPTIDAATIQGFPSVPGYDILRELGRGGMGVVYEARQTHLDRKVALKLMKGDDPLHKARFLAEGQVIAAVKHPHVVAVYDFGESSIGPFIAMEFLTGGTFAGRLAREDALAPRAAAELIAQVASGVGAAHDVGIVHRDLKPGNVLLDAAGAAKVADFGLAKRAASDLTATQAMMGTPSYMAPEQAAGKGKFVGPAADVWSLGVMLYEALTGKRPFAADEVGSLLVAIQNDDPPSLRSVTKTIPPDLETICLKCLEKEPERRYSNAGEMRADLEAWRDGRPIAARRATRMERGMMWVRRKPTVAAAWALGFVAAFLGVFTLFLIDLWWSAVEQRAIATRAREDALVEKNRAIESESEALRQKNLAESLAKVANRAKEEALTEKNRAIESESEALRQKKLAESEAKKAYDEQKRFQVAEARALQNYKLALEEAERAKSIVKRLADTSENQKLAGRSLQELLAKNGSAGAIYELYRSPPAILMEKEFRTAAAAYLAKSSIVPHMAVVKPEAILEGNWKPYTAGAASLSWLKKADELDGASNPEWAVHLYLLSSASRDAETANWAAKRVVLDDSKLKVTDLPLAMEYGRLRALDSTAASTTRVAAFAATARLAFRLMEATFDPKEDAREREAALLPRIATFAQKGLDLAAGNNADRLSLQLALHRRELLSTTAFTAEWLAKNRPAIESIARDIPKDHPDYADAKAYSAFVTLMRFSNVNGDLTKAKADDTARIRAWDGLVADAEAAIRIDPDNGYANRALGMALFGTFKETAAVYPPPDSRKVFEFVRNRTVALKADLCLKRATDALKTRSQPALWRMRGIFLFQSANEFAKAGESPADVRKMLQDAAVSAAKSDDQRTAKLIDDPLLQGRIQEDLAWLAQDRPSENYGAAIRSFNVAATRPQTTADQRLQGIRGRIDLARTVVRAAAFEHFPAARLTEADAALEAVKADIAKLPEAERDTGGVKIESAKGVYWQAYRQLVAGNADAEKSFAEAAEAARPYAADLYAFSHVHRAEAALAGRSKSDAAGKVVQDSADQLKVVLDAEGAVSIRQALAFAPDYLLARKAIAERDEAAAKVRFAAAFEKIDRAWASRSLLVEDSFALRCLAYEIQNAKLNANDLKTRKDLLADLEKAFAWSLTPKDKLLVADALK